MELRSEGWRERKEEGDRWRDEMIEEYMREGM